MPVRAVQEWVELLGGLVVAESLFPRGTVKRNKVQKNLSE